MLPEGAGNRSLELYFAMRRKIESGLFERITSFENLLDAYYHARKCKRYRGDTLRFTANLEDNLFQLKKELEEGTYQVGGYKTFYVNEPKKRLIMALEFRDRVVQWAFYLQINPYLEKWFMFDTYACRKCKGTLAAADRLQSWVLHVSRRPDADKWYYLKLDISKYFYWVDHTIIMKLFRQIIDDEAALRELDKIVNNPSVPFGLPEGKSPEACAPEDRLFEVGMPVGNLSSQMIGNLYLHPLDMFIKHTLRARYDIRYADDIIILHNNLEELKQWKEQIEAFLVEKLLLKLNHKTAIRPVRDGFTFCGYRIYPTYRKLSRRMGKRIKTVYRYMEKAYAKGLLDWDEVAQTMNSYHAIMSHASTYGLRTWIAENIVFTRGGDDQDEERKDVIAG